MIDDDRSKKKDLIVEYLRRFPFYKWAAKYVAIDEDTLINWRKEDKDFSDKVEIARSEGMRYYGGKANPEFILKNADPQTFKDKKEMEVILPTPLLGEDDVQKDNSPKETTATE